MPENFLLLMRHTSKIIGASLRSMSYISSM